MTPDDLKLVEALGKIADKQKNYKYLYREIPDPELAQAQARITRLSAELATAQQTISDLRAKADGLEKFTTHDVACATRYSTIIGAACTCGLDQALAAYRSAKP